jgi:uncharacterized protein (TIGR03382 family)
VLATLGSDVIASTYKNVDPYNFTLTRLHARYGKELGNDLVFRAVDPIVGGRGVPDEHGEVPTKVEHDAQNNFQGRYIILHPWTGAVTCEQPHRGRWGGPPSQQIATQTATNLAFAPRGKVQLASLVARDVPQIGVMSSGSAQLPTPLRAHGCGGCQTSGGAAGAFGVAACVGALVLRRRKRSMRA